ncbi:MAG: U3 small nucleolar RNA-associated protein 13 [Piccolia ochrophora]|nr:MAG: U3 small nucleolar RNA-associated protein 13 [Piccolia ochrophora]
MSTKATVATTFDPENVIQPIYTGGDVALDETGRLLASCVGEDVLLTDLATGQQLGRIEGDGTPVTTLSLTPSGSHIIACSRSLSMRIYSLRPSQTSSSSIVFSSERTLKPHSSPAITSATDSTGSLLATGGADGIVKVWDIRGGYVTHTFRGHSGIISALRFFESLRNEREEQQGKSKTKRKRDGRKSHEIDAEEEAGPNGAGQDSVKAFRLASAAEDGSIRIWDLGTRKCISTLESHVSLVRALDFSEQENTLLSASRDKTFVVWDAKTWRVRRTVPVLERVETAGFIANGSLIYTGGEHGRVRLWNSDSGREITQEQEAGGEGDSVVDIVTHPGLPFLLSVHADQSLLLHSLEPTTSLDPSASLDALPVVRRISGTHDEVIDLAYLASDRSLLALATNSESVRIVSIDASKLASRNDGDLSNSSYFGADVALLEGHEDIVICLDTDWSGHWIATGAKDNTARLWRIDPNNSSFTCFALFTGHTESLGAIALPSTSPAPGSAAQSDPLAHPPQFLLTGSQDRTVKRWDIPKMATSKSPRAKYTRKAHDKDINALDANHNSSLFASASQDKTVKIWSVEEGEVQGVLRGHRRGVWSVRFSPPNTPPITTDTGSTSSGRGLILTGSGDKTVKIWSLSDYSCLRTLEGHTNSVLKVVWLPPPTTPSTTLTPNKPSPVQVASAGSDGLVKVWDATSGELACTLDNHTDRVWSLAASSTSTATRTLVSAGADSVITFWTDTSSATAAAASAETSRLIETDQQLANLTRAGSYRDALVLALTLSSAPSRLLNLLTTITATATSSTEHDPHPPTSHTGLPAADDVLAHLSPTHLFTLLRRVRDWNTNARTAPVAQKVLSVLVRAYPPDTWAGLRARGGGGGGGGGRSGTEGGPRRDDKGSEAQIAEIVAALRAYTERHYRRVEELLEESYLVEYTLGEMDGLEGGGGGGEMVLG